MEDAHVLMEWHTHSVISFWILIVVWLKMCREPRNLQQALMASNVAPASMASFHLWALMDE